MMLRRLLAAFFLALTPLPAAAQYDVAADPAASGATFGEMLVLNKEEPGICAALAAGLAEHATQSFIPDRESALASRVFAEAPTVFDDLECGALLYRDMLDCIVTAYAALRRSLLAGDVTVEEARARHRQRALACAREEAEGY